MEAEAKTNSAGLATPEGNLVVTDPQLHELIQTQNHSLGLLHDIASTKTKPKPQVQKTQFSRLNNLFHTRLIHAAAHHILLVTLVCQAILVTFLSLVDELRPGQGQLRSGAMHFISVSVVVLLTLVNGVLLILTHYAIVHQVIHEKTVGGHISKSFVSSILVFAGLISYTIYIDPSSWTFKENAPPPEKNFILTYFRVLIFCIGSGTFQGIDDNLSPNAWFCYPIIGIQMLVSFGHPVSIMAHFAKGVLSKRSTESAKVRGQENSAPAPNLEGSASGNPPTASAEDDREESVWLRYGATDDNNVK